MPATWNAQNLKGAIMAGVLPVRLPRIARWDLRATNMVSACLKTRQLNIAVLRLTVQGEPFVTMVNAAASVQTIMIAGLQEQPHVLPKMKCS